MFDPKNALHMAHAAMVSIRINKLEKVRLHSDRELTLMSDAQDIHNCATFESFGWKVEH